MKLTAIAFGAFLIIGSLILPISESEAQSRGSVAIFHIH